MSDFESVRRVLLRVKSVGVIALAIACGYCAATWERTAGAKPTKSDFMVEASGVQVHRFADVTAEGVTLCYFTSSNRGGGGISCVKK